MKYKRIKFKFKTSIDFIPYIDENTRKIIYSNKKTFERIDFVFLFFVVVLVFRKK